MRRAGLPSRVAPRLTRLWTPSSGRPSGRSLEGFLGSALPAGSARTLRWSVAWLIVAGCVYAFVALLVAVIEAGTRPAMGGVPGATLVLGTAGAAAHAVAESRRFGPSALGRWGLGFGAVGAALVGVFTIPNADPIALAFIGCGVTLGAAWLLLARLVATTGPRAGAPWRAAIALGAPAPLLAPVCAAIAVGP